MSNRARRHRNQKIAAAMLAFRQSGGEVFVEEEGHPKHWRCGRDKRGNPTDPPNIKSGILHMLSRHGVLEGVNPSPQVFAEAQLWRSDLCPPVLVRFR